MACTFRPGSSDPVEATARVLVVGLLPVLEAAMMAGLTYGQMMDRAREVYLPHWRKWQGDTIAYRAVEILEHVGPAEILTIYGRKRFMQEYAPAIIEGLSVANENARPSRGGIVQRVVRAVIGTFRWPPAQA